MLLPVKQYMLNLYAACIMRNETGFITSSNKGSKNSEYKTYKAGCESVNVFQSFLYFVASVENVNRLVQSVDLVIL